MLVEHMNHMINELANLEYQGTLAEPGRVGLIFDDAFDGIGGRARTKPGKRSLPLLNSGCVYS